MQKRNPLAPASSTVAHTFHISRSTSSQTDSRSLLVAQVYQATSWSFRALKSASVAYNHIVCEENMIRDVSLSMLRYPSIHLAVVCKVYRSRNRHYGHKQLRHFSKDQTVTASFRLDAVCKAETGSDQRPEKDVTHVLPYSHGERRKEKREPKEMPIDGIEPATSTLLVSRSTIELNGLFHEKFWCLLVYNSRMR